MTVVIRICCDWLCQHLKQDVEQDVFSWMEWIQFHSFLSEKEKCSSVVAVVVFCSCVVFPCQGCLSQTQFVSSSVCIIVTRTACYLQKQWSDCVYFFLLLTFAVETWLITITLDVSTSDQAHTNLNIYQDFFPCFIKWWRKKRKENLLTVLTLVSFSSFYSHDIGIGSGTEDRLGD